MMYPVLTIDKSSVDKYLSNMVQDSNHRFKSWEYCYGAFNNLDNPTNYLSFRVLVWGSKSYKEGVQPDRYPTKKTSNNMCLI